MLYLEILEHYPLTQAPSSEMCPRSWKHAGQFLILDAAFLVADSSEVGLLFLPFHGCVPISVPKGHGFQHSHHLPRGVTESEGYSILVIPGTPKASLTLTS